MARRPNVQALLRSVKLERGHDGFLRGKPEPVVTLALLAVGRHRAVLLGKARHVLSVKESFPCRIEIAASAALSARAPAGATRIVVLGMAFESDSGEDIARVTTWLDSPESWQVRAGDSALAAPFRLAELGMFPPHEPPDAQRIHLTHRDQDVGQSCKVDDWVGGSMVVVDTERSSRDTWLLRFTSASKRNDWTAELELRVEG